MNSRRRKQSGSDTPVDRESLSSADTSSAEANQGATDEEEIRARAYELYLERGGGPNDEMEDWLRAEREYRDRGRGDGAAGGDATESPPAA
jgi:hypothetical protein